MREIIYSRRAMKFLRKQSKPDRQRISDAIDRLPAGDTKKLKGNDNLSRLRVGNFRVIYDDQGYILHIVDIGNRGDIYKRY